MKAQADSDGQVRSGRRAGTGRRARWRAAPGSQLDPGWLTSLETAIALGAEGFAEFHREEKRNAWWGRLQIGEESLFVKGRLITAPRQRLASLLLPRGLRREWRRLIWFARTGLPMAEPLALGQYRSRGMLSQSVLVTRWIEDSQPLADVAEEIESNLERRQLIGAAGTLFGELFKRGAIHKQFHPWNVLVRHKADGERELVLVDLQHLWISRSFSDDVLGWALLQVSFWLHAPVIDWVNTEEARVFYQSALHAAKPALKSPERVAGYVEGLIGSGRTQRKMRRVLW